MIKTKETTPYLRVNFHIWVLEKFCGRTLKRNSIKITTQPYEKEEMVFTSTHFIPLLGGYKIIVNVAVVVSIVIILFSLVMLYFTHYNFLSTFLSLPVLVLLVCFFDIFLPEGIRNDINSLLAKEWKNSCSIVKKALDEQKNKN